jgi:hypothetical protein
VTTLEELRHARLTVKGREQNITLYLPRVGDVAQLIFDPPVPQDQGEQALAAELVQIIDVEDRPIEFAAAHALVKRGAEIGPLLEARNRLYYHACEQGRAYAACPRCGSEFELDLLWYALALKSPSWELMDRDVLLARPYLGIPAANQAEKISLPRATRSSSVIRFALPSHRLWVGEPADAAWGRLTMLDAAAETAAWNEWIVPEEDPTPERVHWRIQHPGFRAILRLSLLVEALTDPAGHNIDVTPVTVERMFLADLHFLDILYRFVLELTLSNAPAMVACAACGQHFVPTGVPP